jgi:hypothetical protein
VALASPEPTSQEDQVRAASRASGVITSAAATLALAVPPASAAPPQPYVDDPAPKPFTFCEEIGQPLAFPVVLDEYFTGTERFIERRGGLPHYQAHYRDVLVHSNPLNGKTLTSVYNGLAKDQDITVNADGTLTVTVKVVQRLVVTGTDGAVLFRSAGQLRYSVDVDANGTPNDPSDDVEIEDSFALVKDFVGHDPTRDRSFCGDLTIFIG